MRRNVLLLLFEGVSREALEAAVEPIEGEEVAVYVVAPSRVGPLEWLATDELRAHGEAAGRVLEAEWLLAGSAEIGGEAGESDPVLAVGDALERFAADEIVIAGGGPVDPALVAALRGFGLPVALSGVTLAAPGAGGRLRLLVSSLTSGRSPLTPFVAIAVANLGLLAIVVVGSLLVALVVWLIEST